MWVRDLNLLSRAIKLHKLSWFRLYRFDQLKLHLAIFMIGIQSQLATEAQALLGAPVNRAQRRAAAKAAKKGGDKELSEKIFLFDQMPDECSACVKPFDKTNKEIVRLYCPNCWDKAKALIEQLEEK